MEIAALNTMEKTGELERRCKAKGNQVRYYLASCSGAEGVEAELHFTYSYKSLDSHILIV